MTPPPGQDATSTVKAQHRRNASGSASPRPDAHPKSTKGLKQATSIHYTLLIRLPFARGDFEDPPQVEWDASKDRKLWKIISKNSKSADIDWALHAQEFGVSQPFLLQQAAWLYERHFQHVKAQMNKLRTSNAPSPALGTTSTQPSVGGLAMKRLGSGGGASRAPSALSIRSRDSPLPRVETNIPGTPRGAPPLSRTPSTNTVTQSRHFLPPSSPRQPSQRTFRASTTGQRKMETVPIPSTAGARANSPSPPASSSSSSTSSSDSDQAPVRRSQIFRRPPPFQQHKKTPLGNVEDVGEESDEDSPTFLPFAVKGAPSTGEDPSATLRDTPPHKTTPPRGKGKQPVMTPGKNKLEYSGKFESSASSASSAPGATDTAAQHRRIDALSPRHRAELARLSPRGQGARDGSDGTPSMGSSFSDLEDTSITQSALEEALASNLRHGGASRLSTISHAFGSRLYGRGGQQQG